MKTIFVFLFTACCMLVNGASAYTDSVNPFVVLFGNTPKLSKLDIPLLAEHEIILIDRFRFHEINNNTWKAIKSASPNTKIFLYQLGAKLAKDHDSNSIYYLNNLGRFDVSRGSSDGSINQDHGDWFLTNIYGNRITGESANILLLDFGNPHFVDYWIKHTLEDISFQQWRADGIYIDEATACKNSTLKNLTGYTPKKYLDCESWDQSMNDYLTRVTSALHKENQLIAANRGNSRFASGSETWRALDKTNSPPDFLLEEGAFAVRWGGGDVQFFPVEEWKRQIDLPASITHSSIGMMSHTDLSPNETGAAMNGQRKTYEQILRFAVGSYLLAKNLSGPTTYFYFVGNQNVDKYNKLIDAEVYSKFDIGEPIAKYEKALAKEVYFRKYSAGYVYVNPTNKKIENVQLEPDFQPRDNESVKKIGKNWFVNLDPNDAIILKLSKRVVLPASPSFDIQ